MVKGICCGNRNYIFGWGLLDMKLLSFFLLAAKVRKTEETSGYMMFVLLPSFNMQTNVSHLLLKLFWSR
jgi:hypothetical protein